MPCQVVTLQGIQIKNPPGISGGVDSIASTPKYFAVEVIIPKRAVYGRLHCQYCYLLPKKRDRKVKGKEEVIFASWPLEVKGELRRREIYDYL